MKVWFLRSDESSALDNRSDSLEITAKEFAHQAIRFANYLRMQVDSPSHRVRATLEFEFVLFGNVGDRDEPTITLELESADAVL